MNSFNFCFKKVYFSFNVEGSFHQVEEFWVGVLFSQHFNYSTLLFCCLHCFWGELGYNSYLCFSIGKVSSFPHPTPHPPASFKIFFPLFLTFYNLKIIWFYFVLFCLNVSCLGVLWPFWICYLVFHINLGKFSVVSNYYSIPSFFSIWYSHYIYVSPLVVLSQSLDLLFCFFSIFDLFVFGFQGFFLYMF